MPILPDDNQQPGFTNPDLPPAFEGEETWWSVYAMSKREINEIRFAHLYVEQFDHGTDGHGRLHLIEHMNSVLESLFEMNTQLLSENEAFRDIMAQIPPDVFEKITAEQTAKLEDTAETAKTEEN